MGCRIELPVRHQDLFEPPVAIPRRGTHEPTHAPPGARHGPARQLERDPSYGSGLRTSAGDRPLTPLNVRLPRSRLAACVDALLIALVCLLFAPRLTGLTLHEWFGLLLVGAVVVHLLLSWSWITATTRSFRQRSEARTRLNYLLNSTLFALVVLELASGLMISQVLLPPLGVPTLDDRAWRALHNQALNWTHLLLGIHVAMNWQPLLVALRRYLAPATDARPRV